MRIWQDNINSRDCPCCEVYIGGGRGRGVSFTDNDKNEPQVIRMVVFWKISLLELKSTRREKEKSTAP